MKRKSYAKNDTLLYMLDKSKEHIIKNDTLYIFNAYMFLSKALEGIETKKDLTCSEQEDIKRIRELIKGL